MTIDQQPIAPGDAERVAAVLKIVRERLNRDDLMLIRVLDLACRTGAFSTAFAHAGATVLGVEGRVENLQMTPLSTAHYVHGDVRDLATLVPSMTFDVTLCLGILYHLPPHETIDLLRTMREVTTDFAIIDTHIGAPSRGITIDGTHYAGYWYAEPPGQWSSIGNDTSFWFTLESLHRATLAAGWSKVEDLPRVEWPGEPAGRAWLVIS